MAATDMANNNGAFDPIASHARLSERVENQGKDIIDLRSNMNTGFQGVNANLNALANEVRSNSRTPWPVIWTAIGVCFTILAAVTTFFYGTLNKGQDRLEMALVRLADTTVSQKEMDWRTARGAEDRARTEAAISELRTSTVTRNEWSERNLARDHDVANIRSDIEREVANLQRQLDLQRNDFQSFSSSLGNGRDVIQDLKADLERLREQLTDIRARQFQRTIGPPS